MRRMEPAPIRWPRPTSSPWMRRCPQRRSEEHTSELQSQSNLVCRLLLEKKNNDRRQGRSQLLARLLHACTAHHELFLAKRVGYHRPILSDDVGPKSVLYHFLL